MSIQSTNRRRKRDIVREKISTITQNRFGFRAYSMRDSEAESPEPPPKDGSSIQTSSKNITVVIMGCTGSGKTTFINLASNSHLRVGDGLRSCTKAVQKSMPFTLDDYNVTLVDTPGFDDTVKSDSETVKIVCDYLVSEYREQHCVHGVIYLHRISDNKLSGSSLTNFSFFLQLCGSDALKNCGIVTNMWNIVNEDVGAAREAELGSSDSLFKPALDGQAKLFRHDNTSDSARAIIRSFLENVPLPLAIQCELVDGHLPHHETPIGKTLFEQLFSTEKTQGMRIKTVPKELETAKDSGRHLKGMHEMGDELSMGQVIDSEELRSPFEVEQPKLLPTADQPTERGSSEANIGSHSDSPTANTRGFKDWGSALIPRSRWQSRSADPEPEPPSSSYSVAGEKSHSLPEYLSLIAGIASRWHRQKVSGSELGTSTPSNLGEDAS